MVVSIIQTHTIDWVFVMDDNQFVEVDDAQLDHLAPVEERVEPGFAQDEGHCSIKQLKVAPSHHCSSFVVYCIQGFEDAEPLEEVS